MEHSLINLETIAYDYGFKVNAALEVSPGVIIVGISFTATFTRVFQISQGGLFQVGNASHIDVLEVRTEEERTTVKFGYGFRQNNFLYLLVALESAEFHERYVMFSVYSVVILRTHVNVGGRTCVA